MSDGGFILDKPHEIQAFAYLQVYYKLKLEVEHPGGPTWRDSPMKQAITILKRYGINAPNRKKVVFVLYKEFLEEQGILGVK